VSAFRYPCLHFIIRVCISLSVSAFRYPCLHFVIRVCISLSVSALLLDKNFLSSFFSNTGLFISPSGISDLCGTVTGMVTPKGSMSTEGELLHFSVLPYRFSICPPLVTRQMSNLAILADSKTQNASLFLVHAMFRHDCPLTAKLASTQWNLANKKKKNLERFCTYWNVPFCCVCLGCCAAELGSSSGTYELPCTIKNIFSLG